RYDPRLGVYGEDSQDLMPQAIVPTDTPAAISKPLFKPGGFLYEVAVRAFPILHPSVPQAGCGKVTGLAPPSVVAHLKR
ncbi:glycogen debranching enzyme GlgX, partial [Rhizobium ruizarguesonis]